MDEVYQILLTGGCSLTVGEWGGVGRVEGVGEDDRGKEGESGGKYRAVLLGTGANRCANSVSLAEWQDRGNCYFWLAG